MSRFNQKNIPKAGPRSAVGTLRSQDGTPVQVTGHEGHPSFKRDAKGELFTLAVSFMGGDDNFYEKSTDRYARLLALISEQEVHGDLEWVFNFVQWLRQDVGARTVSMVIAIEVARQRVAAQLTDPIIIDVPAIHDGGQLTKEMVVSNKNLIDVALGRADEPAEMLAYWNAMYGEDRRTFPQYMKAGIGLAVRRLYNEFSYLKYGRAQGKIGFIDVLRAVHPSPKDDRQTELFKFITTGVFDTRLPVINARADFNNVPVAGRSHWLFESTEHEMGSVPAKLKAAGVTWEALSEWSPEGMTGRMWDAIIPNMGLIALMRNLRNFDEKGISRQSVALVTQRLMDEAEIRKARIMPYQAYQAYRSLESVRWSSALDVVLNVSLSNVPVLGGRTLVLVDRSGSMFEGKVSDRSEITYADVGSLFGAAWKLSNPDGVDLWQYGSVFQTRWVGQGVGWGASARLGIYEDGAWPGVAQPVHAKAGGSILPMMKKFRNMGGTQTHKAIEQAITTAKRANVNHTVNYDRLVLITDEQSWNSRYDDLPVPSGMPVYIWNLAGYEAGITKYGRYNRHSFGGLTDQAFKLIPILEAGRDSGWPWEN